MLSKLSKPQIFALSVVVIVLGIAILASLLLPSSIHLPNLSLLNNNGLKTATIVKSNSDAEFRSYIQQAMQTTGNVGVGMGSSMAREMAFDQSQTTVSTTFSQTNVQVKGIDEPDIVKTNGSEIFYSNPFEYVLFDTPMPVDLPAREMEFAPAEDLILPPAQQANTKVVSAFPVESMSLQNEIAQGGQLLLSGDNLLIFSDTKITGYNVADPANPQQIWEHTLEDTWTDTSRLLNGNVYVVTKKYISPDIPCPMPLIMNDVRIACTSIYHPSVVTSTDTVYTILKINPSTGDITNQVSFTGSSNQSVVYVSTNNIYITYSYFDDPTSVMTNFFRQNNNLLPNEYQQRLTQLQNYDISQQAKLVEYEQIIAEYKATLSQDGRLAFEQNMHNLLQNYAQDNIRNVEKTGIVKVNPENLEITNNGTVPGTPLNQFSLDEHNDYLRIVTTVGQNSFMMTSSTMLPTVSVNDMYVLNSELQTIGNLQNLARDERVYSARFMGDTAYVVTFKQIDPFFVFDLSNPNSPQVAGELKIPGYSSYLHPLTDNLILGVGREEAQVKLSLFDVSNKNNPVEVNKYLMDQTWTEVESNHHAFLQDERHQIFFLPTSQGGFIFSYENNEVSLVRTVAGTDIQRALFINDYLYIIGRDTITVLNENDWSTVSTFSL